jgi:hypothetical protein
MNLTLAIDDKVLERARERAKRLGIVVRRHLEEFGGLGSSSAAADELLELMRDHSGDSGGKPFTRSDAYDGRI